MRDTDAPALISALQTGRATNIAIDADTSDLSPDKVEVFVAGLIRGRHIGGSAAADAETRLDSLSHGVEIKSGTGAVFQADSDPSGNSMLFHAGEHNALVFLGQAIAGLRNAPNEFFPDWVRRHGYSRKSIAEMSEEAMDNMLDIYRDMSADTLERAKPENARLFKEYLNHYGSASALMDDLPEAVIDSKRKKILRDYDRAHLVVCVSHHAHKRESHKTVLGCPMTELIVIPHGADIPDDVKPTMTNGGIKLKFTPRWTPPNVTAKDARIARIAQIAKRNGHVCIGLAVSRMGSGAYDYGYLKKIGGEIVEKTGSRAVVSLEGVRATKTDPCEVAGTTLFGPKQMENDNKPYVFDIPDAAAASAFASGARYDNTGARPITYTSLQRMSG